MGNQKPQRLDLASQASTACRDFIDAYNRLKELAARRAYLGDFLDADFTGTSLSYLDAATIGTLFDFVVPSLVIAYDDVANSGRNKQILQQVAPNL